MKNFKFNNKREGKYIENYNSGNISIKCYYKNDKLEGEYIYLLQNYKKMKNFKFNGKLYGKYISYYKSGEIETKCYYKIEIKSIK